MPGTDVISAETGAVRVPLLRLVNTYLVPDGDGGLTLIDTGVAGSAREIVRAAATLGAPAITRIVLTHFHDDHSGALDALHRLLPATEILIGGREARLLAGDTSLQPGEPRGGRLYAVKVATAPTRTLEPGDLVGTLRVHAARGHSPGQIALVDERDRTLYCGDAYATVGGVATTAGPYWRFPFPGLVTWSRPLAQESARALAELEPARLAPGHGPVVEDPVRPMLEALQRSG